MSSREALRAFHHQIGFAYRRLKQGSPALAAMLRPATRTLQTGIRDCGHSVAPGGQAKWPPWEKSTRCSQQRKCCKQIDVQSSMADPCQMNTHTIHVGSNHKVLKQHDTNETDIPAAEDDDAISLTESWADSSVSAGALSAKRRTYSRKPRAGTRGSSGHQRPILENLYA